MCHMVCVCLIVGKMLMRNGYLYNLKIFFKQNAYHKRQERLKDSRAWKLNAMCNLDLDI